MDSISLRELDAHWANAGVDHNRAGLGLSFLCPCCRSVRIIAWFAEPIDGGAPAPLGRRPTFRFKREGETIESLSLPERVNVAGHARLTVLDGMVTFV